MVWAAWPDSREVFHLRLRDIMWREARFDNVSHERSDLEPWVALFGPSQDLSPGKVHNPSCLACNVFLTEAEARNCVYDYCLAQARTLRAAADLWESIAEPWKSYKASESTRTPAPTMMNESPAR